MNMQTPVDETPKPAITLPDNITAGQLIAHYLKTRNRIKAVEEEQKKALAPAKEMLALMGNKLLDMLNQADGQSIAANAGTAYRTERVSVSIEDGQAFRDHVIANEMFELLDWKANSTAVQDYVREHGELPPGTKVNVAFTVGVRTASAK